jgi:hypothetical protein
MLILRSNESDQYLKMRKRPLEGGNGNCGQEEVGVDARNAQKGTNMN